MQDTIIIGNGTSKQIKMASLPNNYAEFKAMAENGNLFADISLNADGCEVVGTPLNKLNLLTDETATKWNANNVDEALSNAFDIVENLPIVLESEIIFEGETGNFTKSFDNFDAISILTMPTDNRTTYTSPNPMIPTKQLLDRFSIVNEIRISGIWTNSDIYIIITQTSIKYNTNDIRVYGHNIKAVLNNG